MLSEHNEHSQIEGPSDRSFGLTVGGILLLIEIYRLWGIWKFDTIGIILLAIATPLIVLGCVYPSLLALFNRAWMKLGLIMFKVVNPVIMFAVYVLTIIPIGFILRITGKDPMRMQLDKEAKTYWIERNPVGPSPESMKNQF